MFHLLDFVVYQVSIQWGHIFQSNVSLSILMFIYYLIQKQFHSL